MQLVKWDKLKHEIEVAKDWDTLQHLTDRVKAYQIWSKQTKQSLETQNQIAVYRLRLERLKGNWLNDNIPHGNNQYKKEVEGLDLQSIGVSKHESSVARQIAAIPDNEFESFIATKTQEAQDKIEEITTAGALRFARSLQQPEQQTEEPIQIAENREAKIKEIADHINRSFTASERSQIIQLIRL